MNSRSQLIRFSLVGVGNTLVDFTLFYMLTALMAPLAWAQTLASLAGVANSYVMNRRWTFPSKRHSSIKEVAVFLLVNGASLGLSTLLLILLHDWLHYSLLLSKAGATIASMAVNYMGSRHLVFKNQLQTERENEHAEH
jgi:putative flippase GtrA